MKKLILIVAITFAGLTTMNAQTWKVGANFGIPVADASDVSSFALGIDVYYYFTDIDDFINIGATVGYRNFFGKQVTIDPFSEGARALQTTVTFDDAQFLPIAAAGRLKFFDVFSAGLDVGYAIGITDGLDGGFYLKPVVGWDILDFLEINLGYENISDAATWGNFNLGVLFEF